MAPLRLLAISLVRLLLLQACADRIYSKLTDLATTKFIFLIIGSDATGNVLANRLTENSHISVLVLEAGGSNEGVLDSEVLFFCSKLSQAHHLIGTSPQRRRLH
ncbi:hypothetical protein BDN71DRAFT_1061821 [Pleurotus eryngii]|uniref:Uncharacterized protein n=1 Tax=Pleurotus eryngii TaxID=5323 RepID=A0A9P5ZTQ9_PLEER|nr:hypothetical protein BDN71DRAFT_1061821 [Pleurotus eryngii]